MTAWISSLIPSLSYPHLAAGFTDAAIKSAIILGTASLVSLLLRRSAACTRHLVWLLAVAGILCLPGLVGLLPAWHRPLWAVGTVGSSANEITLTLALAPGSETNAALREASAAAGTITPASRAGRSPGYSQLSTHFHLGWAAAILTVWMLGTVILLISIWVGNRRLRQIRCAAHSPGEEWSALLLGLCVEMGIRRRVTLLQSEDELMPVTWGWLRPVILLPAEADEWLPERRRVVLLHELAHIKRLDCLTQWLARLACSVYWFNPLVWVAARQMCVERERACDDLVLSGGFKASEYAGHLLEIARSFQRVPLAAAIAMARSTELEGRISAIVDGSRSRRGPRAVALVMSCAAVFALLAAVAAQKPEGNSREGSQAVTPWYNERLSAFFAAKEAQARQLAAKANLPVAKEVWPYFEAGIKGDWQTTTNLWLAMRKRAHQYEGSTSDDRLDVVWGPILETDLAWEEYSGWKEKYVLAFGNDIIKSIPPGSIYFGGTDPGRGVITAMCDSHAEAKPFFTLTQNALADSTYLDYLRAMYMPRIVTPTSEDSQQCFAEYVADAQKRLAEKKLKPGEDVQMKDGKVQVGGQVSVMAINALIVKTIFDKNPDREFFIEESFPLDWMFPHLTPNGLIMKINRQPPALISDETIQQDHAYWANYLRPMIGDWITYDTSVADLVAFVERVYIKHDLSSFRGDPEFLEDVSAQKAFSKLRSAIAGVYAWRTKEAKPGAEKQRMEKEADFAFRQAFALCPYSPEALFRYVGLLTNSGRIKDARILAEITLKLDPKNTSVQNLLGNLKEMKTK